MVHIDLVLFLGADNISLITKTRVGHAANIGSGNDTGHSGGVKKSRIDIKYRGIMRGPSRFLKEKAGHRKFSWTVTPAIKLNGLWSDRDLWAGLNPRYLLCYWVA